MLCYKQIPVELLIPRITILTSFNILQASKIVQESNVQSKSFIRPLMLF